MRECPSCLKEKVDTSGRCTNTSCTCYCMKVLEGETGLKCDGYEVRCQSMDATRTRQNTKYVEEESNWNTLCEECQKETDEYWADMWSDYYSGCL